MHNLYHFVYFLYLRVQPQHHCLCHNIIPGHFSGGHFKLSINLFCIFNSCIVFDQHKQDALIITHSSYHPQNRFLSCYLQSFDRVSVIWRGSYHRSLLKVFILLAYSPVHMWKMNLTVQSFIQREAPLPTNAIQKCIC